MSRMAAIRLGLMVFSLVAATARAETWSFGHLAALSHGKLSSNFVHQIDLPVAERVRYVIYGNRDYGYYRIDKLKHREGVVSFEIAPPGYKSPLEFYTQSDDGAAPVHVPTPGLTFSSPMPEFLAADMRVSVAHGELSSPFFLVDGAFGGFDISPEKGEKRRAVVVYIVNRFGEIVWAHVPDRGREVFDSYAVAKPLGGGKYGLLFSQKESFFEIVDFRGKTSFSLNPRESQAPFWMHHDFQMLSETTLLTFSNSSRFYRDPSHPFAAPKGYLASTIVAVDLVNKSSRQLWDAWDVLNPATVPQWGRTFESKDTYKAVWDGPTLDYDFDHANTLDRVDGVGYLLSLKNLDMLMMLDESMKKVLWTVGSGEGNTFRTAGDAVFYQQHHVSYLGPDRLLLVDNGIETTRILELRLDRDKGVATVARDFRADPPIYAPTRGSAEVTPDGKRLIAFYVGKDDERRPTSSYIVEFDYATGREVGRMELAYNVHHVGYRAMPLAVIGTESPVPAPGPAAH